MQCTDGAWFSCLYPYKNFFGQLGLSNCIPHTTRAVDHRGGGFLLVKRNREGIVAGVWRQLEQELECARSGRAEQVLPGQGCFWEEIEGESSDGSSEGSLEEFTARSDGGFEATGPAEAEGDGDVWCAATVTAAAPADTVQQGPRHKHFEN